MKKIISIVLSLVMLLSVSVASVNAFAATVGSIESTTKQNKVTVLVNGKSSNDAYYERDPEDPKTITFTYDGDGELIGWEFLGLTEGVEYEIIEEDDDSITIRLADDYEGDITANAIVKEDSETTNATTKKSSKKTSPKTGAGMAGVAAMGAGAAILAALKKKEDAE